MKQMLDFCGKFVKNKYCYIMETLYCIYNAKNINIPILIEINDFNKKGNVYSFNMPEYGYLTNIKLNEHNLFIDYGLSTGNSPLEWIYVYTNDKILAEKILKEESESLGAGMFGGNYRSIMKKHSENNNYDNISQCN